MKKLFTRLSAIPAAVSAATLPFVVYAADNPFLTAGTSVTDVGTEAGITNQPELTEVVGRLINIVLGFLGIVLLLIILYAGFMWMTAGGDEGKVKTARQWIGNAVIGLIIIVAAFAISSFVLGSLVNVTQ